jgi:carbonic anhydrase/acetyltransferase-like protein (isoleucine patch superfamily)
MSYIITVRGFTPQVGNNCFIAPNATIAGDVTIGDDCSVWFNAVLRGDVNSIKIGNLVNIQDGAVVHCTYKRSQTTIGDRVSVGHNAIVHGCAIHENVLVGMGAIIMDNAVVESNCIIAAGAVVLQNEVLKSGGIYAGVPAKRVKEVSEEMIKGEINRIAESYTMYAGWFADVQIS